MRTYLLLLGLLALTIYSCTNKEAVKPSTGPEPTACDSMTVTSTDVYAVITSRCAGCHKGSTAPAGADFSTLAKFTSFVSSNNAVFRQRVLSSQADMPPSGPLRQTLRDSISCWIDKGMPE